MCTKETPIDFQTVKSCIKDSGIKNIGTASIREIRKLINTIELKTEKRYIRMEMGIPGLETPQLAINGEKAALDMGCSSNYPDIDGVTILKNETSRFIRNFMGLDISSCYCIPTVGSINGAYAAFMVAGRMDAQKDTILFLDPGFPVHRQLVKMVGLKEVSVDVYDYRGEKLREKLESLLKEGNISIILYSNPNNPSWICFTEEELRIFGELASEYDAVVVEDLAYFAMDFRKNIAERGVPPFQASVANYTDNFILLISTSKAFSYAGQRVGLMAVSPKIFNSDHVALLRYFRSSNFGHSLVYGALYGTTAGVSHSSQYGVATLLKAINDGTFDFIEELKKYGERAAIMKKMFLNNGFHLVYDKDVDKPIGDGFYFTIAYQGFTGDQLIEEMIYYGISAISLSVTGSVRKEGVRACVSLVVQKQLPELEYRLNRFREDHPV